MRHILRPLEKVGNVELFYDLIFAYLVSVVTSLLHTHEGFFDLQSYGLYVFSFLTVLQVWFNTTFLMNRYGDGSHEDNICMFVNMFCLYFLGEAISGPWGMNLPLFCIAWALLLVNLIVHWYLKLTRYVNTDDEDRRIILSAMRMLGFQLALVIVSLLVPRQLAPVVADLALVMGVIGWWLARKDSAKPVNFDHLAERCCLLVIITFGESVVDISAYMRALSLSHLLVSALVFALVVGCFLIYDFEYEHLLDHDQVTGGVSYTVTNSWVVFVLGNLAAALGFMPDQNVPLIPKGIYMTACLVLYLLCSFLLNFFNRPLFRISGKYVAVRLSLCSLIALATLLTHFDPTITLVLDVAIVYAAFGYTELFFRRRTQLVNLSKHLGLTCEELSILGYTFETRTGREKIQQVMGQGFGD